MPHFQDVIDQGTAEEIVRLGAHLRAAAAAHHEHEATLGHADPFWSDWYANWMVSHACDELISARIRADQQAFVNTP